MTTSELSLEFDILYNNISSGQAPGLTEEEKSSFLTKAYFELVKNYFNPKGNKYLEGIDGSSKRQTDLEHLIVFEAATLLSETTYLGTTVKQFRFTKDYLTLLEEFVKVSFTKKDKNNQEQTLYKYLTVVPLSSSEYLRLRKKPFNYPAKNQVWKINTGEKKCVFITSPSETLESYEVRYVKIPDKIDLEGSLDVSISDSFLQEITQRAVELAKNAWEGNLETTLQLGNRSE